jgi:DeoR family transcriptional regulator, aga operon transcriptional repressor
MPKAKRWNAILELLSSNGTVDVTTVAAKLGVSSATVRRDLRDLEEQKLLSRTHGGALASGMVFELPLRYKGGQRHEEKRRIARKAAARVADGLAIGFTGGTTTTEVARALLERKDLTVVTNALNIASELAVWPDIHVLVTGGAVRSQSYELIGPLAEQTLASLNLDLVFAGVDGISAEHGLTTHQETEAYTNRAMIKRASRTIVVADSSKLGRVRFSVIAPITAIDELITDDQADPAEVEQLREAGIEVTLA